MIHLYEIFSGEELKIAEKIQQRRYQMLVHSYIYYEMNENIVSDSQWSKWAVELADLQKKYPEIASQVRYANDFADWDGSSGAFLTYVDKSNIVMIAHRLLQNNSPQNTVTAAPPKKVPLFKTNPAKKKLF